MDATVSDVVVVWLVLLATVVNLESDFDESKTVVLIELFGGCDVGEAGGGGCCFDNDVASSGSSKFFVIDDSDFLFSLLSWMYLVK